MQSPILAPMMTLVLWTFVMWFWLYATRLPAIQRLNIQFDPQRPPREFIEQIPPRAQWKADNYNHLHEQPTLFYAVALILALTGAGGGASLALAWAYVGLRIVHSLIQSIGNVVMWRFAVFVMASLVLLALTIHAAIVVFCA